MVPTPRTPAPPAVPLTRPATGRPATARPVDPRRRRSRRWPLLLTVLALIVAAVAACTSDPAAPTPGGQAGRSASAAQSFKGVCPDTVAIQSDWWAQAEYASPYRLLGQNPKVDTKKDRVTAALVDNGVDTGVKLEIRSGGPANNFTPAASVLYADDSVMLGSADLDAAVSVSATKPIVGVFGPLDISPVALMWDPAKHPDWHTIADIGQTNTKVVYFAHSAYMDFLVNTAQLKRSQVAPSYGGTPDQWKASRGTIVQQGFLTNEVISYQQDPAIWGKKIDYQLVSDANYPVYPEMLTVRADKLDQYGPCLRKLVPALQRATVAYVKDPGPTNALLSALVAQSPKAVPYTPEHAAAATKVMLQAQIIGNGRGDRTVGNFDPERVTKIINTVRPIYESQHLPIRAGLTPDQVATNRFIDPSIGLPPAK